MAEAAWKDEFSRIWEGNRRLTVRVARAFPGEALWATPVPAMRSFGALLEEILSIERAYIRGLSGSGWKFEMLQLPKGAPWDAVDAVREETRRAWEAIPMERLTEVTPDPFGWSPTPASTVDRLQYALENEIHHRGQGYVYLRLLGVEPPAFYIRD